MDVTDRDIADFYRLALENSNSDLRLASIPDVVGWVDSLIAASDVPDGWMLELSLIKTPDAAQIALSQIPTPATEFLGASIFVAYIDRLWNSGVISRDEACHLLWNVRDALRPEHVIAAIVPKVTLEDADACVAQGGRDLKPFTRVDETLIEFFGYYSEFSSLIPAVSVASGG